MNITLSLKLLKTVTPTPQVVEKYKNVFYSNFYELNEKITLD